MSARYAAMAIPGRAEDCSDTWWFIYDRQDHRDVKKVGQGAAAGAKAEAEARRMNTRVKLTQAGYCGWCVSVGGVHLGAVRHRPDQITSKWQWSAHSPDGQLLPIGLGGYGWGRSRKAAVEQLIAWHEAKKGGAK
ncbi:MAG: hypothetical protein AB7W59_00420 [Acidimicrobiia bacterium]